MSKSISRKGLRRALAVGLISSSLFFSSCGKDQSGPTTPSRLEQPTQPPNQRNNSPIINSTPISRIDEASFYQYCISATDPDGDLLNYSLVEGPNWLSVSNNCVYGTTPAVSENVNLPVKIRVADIKSAFTDQAYILTIQNRPSVYSLSPQNPNQVSSVQSDRIVFPSPVSFSPQDIIVSGISNNAPQGFLREVIGLSSDRRTVFTKQATLEQALGDVNFSSRKTISSSGINSFLGAPGVYRSDSPLGISAFNLSLKDVVLFDLDGNENTRNDQVAINGNLSFDIDLLLGLKTENRSVKRLSIQNMITERAEISLSSKFIGSLQIKEKIIATYDNFSPIVITTPTTPPIPIVVIPKIEVVAGILPSLSRNLEARVTQQATLSPGLVYENGSWNAINDFSNSFDFSTPDFRDSKIEVYAGPRLSFLFYGIAGPYGTISNKLKLDFSDGNSKLYGGLAALVGINPGVFSNSIPNFSRTVIDSEKLLASEGNPGGNNDNCEGRQISKIFIQPSPSELDDAEVRVFFYPDGSQSYQGLSNEQVIEVSKRSSRNAEALLKFPLSSIPPGSNIHSARLRVNGIAWSNFSNSGNEKINVVQIISSWRESDVRWDTKPRYGEVLSSANTIMRERQWNSFDITSLFRKWYKSEAPNYGVALVDPDNGDSGFRLNSSDNSDSSTRPGIEVEYCRR